MMDTFPGPCLCTTGIPGSWQGSPGLGKGYESLGQILRQVLLHLLGASPALFINGCSTSAFYNTEKGEMLGVILT